MTYQALISVVTGIGLVGCVHFVVRYWWRTGGAWMRDEAGRFLMVFWGTLGALFALVLANQWLGDWPARRVVTVVVFVAFVVMTWWPSRLLSVVEKRRGTAMDKTSARWRLIHLEPVVFRAAVVAVVALLGALGIFLDPAIPDALVTAWVALAAIVQTVWTRPAVTANARVVSLLPDPAEPDVIRPGEAVTTASNVAIIDAATDTPG